MNIFYEIEKLIYYGLKHSLIEDEDRILIRNEILEVLEMDDFQELSETELYSLKEELESTEYPSEILNNIINWCIQNNKMEIHNVTAEPWKVTLVETGLNTMTGGRLKKVQKYIGNEQFMLTYGDGVSDVNIAELVRHHEESGKKMTVTAYKPQGKFGSLDINSTGDVKGFTEKPAGDGMWINAGFFVCEPEVFDYITEGDSTIFEKSPLENIAKNGEMTAYKHNGFWQPMDILRDNKELNSMWDNEQAPWKVWE